MSILTNRRSLCFALGLAAVPGVVSGQTVGLNNTWTEYDPNGIETLSGQSATGFTATHNNTVSDGPERPRIYQEFGAIDFSTLEVGNTIAMQFDVQFNTVPDVNDTDFRFGLFDTSTNTGMVAMYDLGNATGSSVRARYDDELTSDFSDPSEGPIAYIPGNWNDALEGGNTLGNTGNAPNGQSLSDTTTVHSFEMLLTRTDGGFDVSQRWRNDAAPSSPEEITLDFNFDYTTTNPGVYRETPNINSIDAVGFAIMDNEPFNPSSSGSYTLSGIAVKNLGFGDLALDATLDAMDIDFMFDAINDAAAFGASQSLTDAQTLALADLSGNGSIGSEDQEALLQDVFGTTFGDVNLDGSVTFADLNIASGNEDNAGGWADGDQNGDGLVNAIDLSIIQDLLGDVIAGDYNGDGFVSQADLDLVLLNWGDSTVPAEWVAADQFDGVLVSQNELDGVLLNWGSGTPPVVAIPEPASLAMLALSGVLLCRRQSRSQTTHRS